MAHHKSAKKRIKTNEIRRQRNKADMSKLTTLVKKVHSAETKTSAEPLLKETVSFIDKIISKKRLHKNTGGRTKSRLTKFVNALKD